MFNYARGIVVGSSANVGPQVGTYILPISSYTSSNIADLRSFKRTSIDAHAFPFDYSLQRNVDYRECLYFLIVHFLDTLSSQQSDLLNACEILMIDVPYAYILTHCLSEFLSLLLCILQKCFSNHTKNNSKQSMQKNNIFTRFCLNMKFLSPSIKVENLFINDTLIPISFIT